MDRDVDRARHLTRGRDLVAVILAIGVALFVVIAAVGISVQHDPLSEVGGNLLATVLGGMTGAVATYLGVTLRASPDEEAAAPEQARDGAEPGAAGRGAQPGAEDSHGGTPGAQ